MSLVNRNKVNMGSIVIHASKQHMEKTGETRKYQNYPNLGVGARGISNRNRIYSKTVCPSFIYPNPKTPTNVTLLSSDSTSMTLLITSDDKYTLSYTVILTPIGSGTNIQKVTTSKTVVFDDLDSNKYYNVSVTAYNPTGYSAVYYNTTTPYYTTIAAPSDLRVTQATTESLTIQFKPEAFANDTLSYFVSYSSTFGISTISDISGTDLITDEDNRSGTFTYESYTITGLQPGTLYTISVSAVGSSNRKSSYVTIEEDTLTEPITALDLTSISTSSIGINYTAPESADTIDMYRITYVYGESTTTLDVSNNVTSYTLTGLTPNTEYQVSVVTNNKNGVSAGDSVALTDTQYTLPLSPSDITVTGVDATNATINFTQPTNNSGLTYGLVYYPTSSSSSKTSLSITASPYTITDLVYPVAYTVELKSVNDVADTSSSIIDTSFNTPDSIPTAPRSLTNEGTTESTITISFQPPISGTVDKYIIKYMDITNYYVENITPPVWENSLYTTTIDVSGNILEYTIGGLSSVTSYYIRVYAYNEIGTSNYATFYANDGVTETTVKTSAAAEEVIDIYVPKNFTERLSESVTL